MRAQRATLLALLALACMPTSSSVTSPCPHRPLWARARGSANPDLFLERPQLGSARVCAERDGSPWGRRSTVVGEERREQCLMAPRKDGATGERIGGDGCERPSETGGEVPERMRWGVLGRLRGGGLLGVSTGDEETTTAGKPLPFMTRIRGHHRSS